MFMSLVVVASISAFVVVCIAQGFLPYTLEQINENPHPAVGTLIFFTILKAYHLSSYGSKDILSIFP